MGLSRATARRALITLEYLGYVVQSGARYTLTASTLGLGAHILTRLTLAQIATPRLEELSAQTGHSASIAVLQDSTEIMYVAHGAAATRPTAASIHPGTRLPAYATAMGRVQLAALPEPSRVAALRAAAPTRLTSATVVKENELLDLLRRVHDEGYAIVDEELEVGLRSIAVPILGRDGSAVAAVNLAMHADRSMSASETASRHLPELRAAASAIEADLAVLSRFGRPAIA